MEASRWIRSARRVRRLSQRELAALAGVPLSTVGRLEARSTNPRFDTVETLLGALGYEPVLSDRKGRLLVVDDDHDRLRDRGGRRFPAHLDAARTPGYFETGNPRGWWGWERIAWPFGPGEPPEYTYWRRPAPRGSGTWGFLDPPERPWEDAT